MLVTKFTHGAWIVVIAMPLLYLLMLRIRRHYDTADAEAAPRPGGVTLPSRIHAVVPVVKINEPTLRTLAFARAIHPDDLTAVTVRVDPAETDQLFTEWVRRDIPVPLTVIDSPFRDITQPLVDHVRSIRRRSPRDVVCVFIPEYVVGHWWEALLHNQTALRLKARLLFQPGVMVTSVPWQLRLQPAPRWTPRTAPPSGSDSPRRTLHRRVQRWDAHPDDRGQGSVPRPGRRPSPAGALPAGFTGLSRRRHGAGAALLCAGLLVLALAHEPARRLDYAVPVLLVLALVVAAALLGGMRVALPGAVAGALLLNWFLTPPYGTLRDRVGRAGPRPRPSTWRWRSRSAGWSTSPRAAPPRPPGPAPRPRRSPAWPGPRSPSTRPSTDLLAQVRQVFGMREAALLERDGGGWTVVEASGEGAPDTDERELRVPAGHRPCAAGARAGAVRRRPAGAGQLRRAPPRTRCSRRRLAERAAEAARLEAADRMRTTLLAGVGHDLRTPLAASRPP